ncbi:MAG TPA: tRNA (N6-isopentenyl adenosine(37)-C2)-methylthiotransferase MiaB [Chitinophagales bacterium]|nr:tRNA (N6-isopentenyl adenosine(37)-C2)-methylthiotransferase MiaB [Chitinophagales bacterium]HNE44731.1 tRNA (N6-isopentenyl adenosine(37)-C2)-methylthiotransferase MiaB [Chitinophagales bacterium]HNI53310.1 tRNA (N6-isopentenyl adenosine(37)-C2)-methylthiotransferase MiaB [Chitinophagales bacterium]HNJ88782.1 tRNA (N6-isopentenyl adenosine(37)-C2)-methylthiotransferase MiaB [Chitinophagales bacterium]HNM08677.1 tRNA (N6-isopentenyl adenosine(37)-C2)-methylthiotransferase MiaB [Chitinophagal
MYDNNPTLEGLDQHKLLDETRQGEALGNEAMAEAATGKRFYIESYGCQMNFSDSEIVASILHQHGFGLTNDYNDADLILLNTCAIRDNAEQRVRNRLKELGAVKKRKPEALIGMLGCMAERLKADLLEEAKLVDIVCGPDAYRDLPMLVNTADDGAKAVNVLLSREETYSDISPLRLDANGVCAFISIMRGCDNMCSFCVVPFTRGRERSRNAFSILAEARDLFERGYKEVTLLGQNVDSYKWENPETGKVVNFAELMAMVASVDPSLRVRFSTSHPKDITDEVLHTMARFDNICNYIHLPVQSGNSRVLELMNRTYDREWYLDRINAIRNIVPDCGISTDVITGFCSETEEEHQDTLSLMEMVQYDLAYMFFYSERPGTLAARKYTDDIPHETKIRRLNEIIALQTKHSHARNQADIGKTFTVLVEKPSKRSALDMCGRNDQNKMVVFPATDVNPGDYVQVRVTSATSATLIGEMVGRGMHKAV